MTAGSWIFTPWLIVHDTTETEAAELADKMAANLRELYQLEGAYAGVDIDYGFAGVTFTRYVGPKPLTEDAP